MPAVPKSKRGNSDNSEAEFRKILDRFGELDTCYRQAKPWLDEREALKVQIRAHCDDQPAALPVRLEGTLYYVNLSPKEKKRTVIAPGKVFAALKKSIGLEKLAEALSYTMKLIDAHLPKAEQVGLIREELTGARDVTAVVITAPAA